MTKTRSPRHRAAPKPVTVSTQRPMARRTWIVFGSLVCMLTFTGALLKALDPGPLLPDASGTLFAIGDQTIERIFETSMPLRSDHWKTIYIHQSLTQGGDARSLGTGAAGLADHFVIGNGNGCGDGEIQIGRRWTQQLPAGMPSATEAAKPDWISICVVGDFNHSRPTATQQARLVQLVGALQRQFHVPAGRIILISKRSSAGAGEAFPAAEFRAQLAE